MSPHSRPPRASLIPLRVLLITGIFILLSFAISLLLGILGISLWAALHHTTPKLTLVYRYFAPPVAGVIGLITLVAATVLEVRHYRQAKALAAIERMSF
jgi:hypothetical protein